MRATLGPLAFAAFASAKNRDGKAAADVSADVFLRHELARLAQVAHGDEARYARNNAEEAESHLADDDMAAEAEQFIQENELAEAEAQAALDEQIEADTLLEEADIQDEGEQFVQETELAEAIVAEGIAKHTATNGDGSDLGSSNVAIYHTAGTMRAENVLSARPTPDGQADPLVCRVLTEGGAVRLRLEGPAVKLPPGACGLGDGLFHDADGEVPLLAAAMTTNTTVQELNLGGTSIHDVSGLAPMLAQNSTLQKLVLNSNGIRDIGALAAGLAKNGALKELNLRNNAIRDVSALGEALRHNGSLRFLWLEDNCVSEASALRLLQVVKDRTERLRVVLQGQRSGGNSTERLVSKETVAMFSELDIMPSEEATADRVARCYERVRQRIHTLKHGTKCDIPSIIAFSELDRENVLELLCRQHGSRGGDAGFTLFMHAAKQNQSAADIALYDQLLLATGGDSGKARKALSVAEPRDGSTLLHMLKKHIRQDEEQWLGRFRAALSAEDFIALANQKNEYCRTPRQVNGSQKMHSLLAEMYRQSETELIVSTMDNVPLLRAKVAFVGRGRAGKTSTFKSLKRHQQFDAHESSTIAAQTDTLANVLNQQEVQEWVPYERQDNLRARAIAAQCYKFVNGDVTMEELVEQNRGLPPALVRLIRQQRTQRARTEEQCATSVDAALSSEFAETSSARTDKVTSGGNGDRLPDPTAALGLGNVAEAAPALPADDEAVAVLPTAPVVVAAPGVILPGGAVQAHATTHCLPAPPLCNERHEMHLTNDASGGYFEGWECDGIACSRVIFQHSVRYCCTTCEYDLCLDCVSERTARLKAREKRDSSSSGHVLSSGGHVLDDILALMDTNPERTKTLSIWDFGGQNLFFPLHHLLLSAGGVYVVLVNLKEMLLRPGELIRNEIVHRDGAKHSLPVLATDMSQQDCLHTLAQWLKLIFASGLEGTPVIVVGTCRDAFDTQDLGIAARLINETVKASPCRNYVTRNNSDSGVAGGDYSFFVDNTQGRLDAATGAWEEHPSVTHLRRTIDRESNKLKTVDELVPVRWLEVLEHFETLELTHLAVKEVHSVARRFGLGSATRSGHTVRVEDGQ